ncbi:MAG: TrbG/VirB9 family P-type conjugative transfer protein [Hyphomonadaceae bacterium]|nr:TrbG/VirB9 family P-type conjugative transfer protein [Hyphomonadaceae bacterium]
MMRVLVSVALCGLAFVSNASAQEAPVQCPAPLMGAPDAPEVPRSRRAPSPVEMLAAANSAARQRPETTSFVQARQIYTYAPGAIYELYANPNFISAILLEPGESLNDVAAGDTSRWMVQETNAESEIDGRTVVLVKPQAIGLRTNIVLVTDRRTYTIEAIAQGGSAYAAQVAWCYPETSTSNGVIPTIDRLDFGYRIRTTRGSRPSWLPTRVFDDGRRTWIEMPADVASTDLPPLFVITGEGTELVNYRVQGQRYMVDRVFDVAELRLGTRAPVIVRIERERASTPAPPRRRFGARP